jgi:hypothetical protein
MARSFSCGTCAALCGAAVVYPDDSATFGIGFTGSLGGASFEECLATCGQCGGTVEGPVDEIPSWSSSNSSIASLTAGVHSARATFKGIAGGLAYGDVQATDEGCTAQASGPITVNPTISQDKNLWYFGNSISAPTGFTLGSTTATLTASGGSTGSFAWTVTQGASKLQFENGSTSITKTNANTVGISSNYYSTTAKDVTVQLQYTPSGGTPLTTSYSLSIDSPYTMIPNGVTHKGVNSCPDTTGGGTHGYKTQAIFTAQSFFGVMLTNIGVNEDFGTIADDYIGNNWPIPTAGGLTIPGTGLFADTMCVVDPGLILTPRVLTPQSPLTNVKIDHSSQFWFVGSVTPASGVEVQSDTQQYFQDHGLHLSIVSPVR